MPDANNLPLDKGEIYLRSISISPRNRKKGIGSEAISIFEKEHKQIGNNRILLIPKKSEGFWKKQGYKIVNWKGVEMFEKVTH